MHNQNSHPQTANKRTCCKLNHKLCETFTSLVYSPFICISVHFDAYIHTYVCRKVSLSNQANDEWTENDGTNEIILQFNCNFHMNANSFMLIISNYYTLHCTVSFPFFIPFILITLSFPAVPIHPMTKDSTMHIVAL